MSIDVNEELVRHVARLARLDPAPEELRALEEHFVKVLAFVESFQNLDTEGVDPGPHPPETGNVWRADEAAESLGVTRALANAPAAREPSFLVPRIIDQAFDVEAGG
jgi:aspartyl-tRNA(Asn)/glutamyl-tRNA(Gln) amidotransferase subunit C